MTTLDRQRRPDRFRLHHLLSAIEHDRVTPELLALVDQPGRSAADVAVQVLLSEPASGVRQAAAHYMAVPAGTMAAAAHAAALVSCDAQVIEAMLRIEAPAKREQITQLGRAIVDLPVHCRDRTIAAVECEQPEFGRLLRHAANPVRLYGPILDIVRGMVTAKTQDALVKWRERARYIISDGVPERVARAVAEVFRDGVLARSTIIDCGREYIRIYGQPGCRTLRALCAVGACVDDGPLRSLINDALWRAPEDLRDVSRAVGTRAVELALQGEHLALDIIEADYPQWGELLAERLAETQQAAPLASAP